MSFLELLPSFVTPGASHVTPGALADEFLSSSGVLFLPSIVTPDASHVNPGALANEITSSSGVLLSLSYVIFVHTGSCDSDYQPRVIYHRRLSPRARRTSSCEKTMSQGARRTAFEFRLLG